LALPTNRARDAKCAAGPETSPIDFQHGEPAKKILRGVEEIVIVDF